MLKEKIYKFIFDHPNFLHLAKMAISNKLVANSSFYRHLVMKRANRFSKESKAYENAISIETTLNCNSRCVFCAHHEKIMTGTMDINLYKKIIDECNDIGMKTIFFGVYGEFLVDKYRFERIEYLRKYGMNYGFITNASLLNPEITNKLFDMGGLINVNFSVNGFSKEVYEKTMVGLKRDVAYKNIIYFLEQKKKRQLNNLSVVVSAVRTDLNREDMNNFFNFWNKQGGVETVFLIELMDRMGKEYKGEIGELGAMSKGSNWLSPCKYLWEALRVYYDGEVSSCCKEDDKRELIVGDLSKESLRDVLEGKALKSLRECHLSGNRKNHPICGKCNLNSIWFS
jgi:MoaA/NifB/PqqE/SkfB family radical SAM enzyme